MLDDLMCLADDLFLDKIKDKAKLRRLQKEYYSSTIYNNRLELVDELYNFCMKYIDCDTWEVHISLDGHKYDFTDREYENFKYSNFECYYKKDYFGNKRSSTAHCWGGLVDLGYYGTKLVVNNNYVEHEFVFKDHGYGNANQVSAYELMTELNKKLNGELQTNVDKKEIHGSSPHSSIISAINNAATGTYTSLSDNDGPTYEIRLRDIFICSHKVWVNSERYKYLHRERETIKDI